MFVYIFFVKLLVRFYVHVLISSSGIFQHYIKSSKCLISEFLYWWRILVTSSEQFQLIGSATVNKKILPYPTSFFKNDIRDRTDCFHVLNKPESCVGAFIIVIMGTHFILILCIINFVSAQEFMPHLNYTPSGPLIHCHFLWVFRYIVSKSTCFWKKKW